MRLRSLSHPEAMRMEIESEDVTGKELMAYRAIKHAIGRVNLWGSEVEGRVLLQYRCTEALASGSAFDHLNSAVGEWESPLFCGMLLIRQAEFLNGCGVDEHGAGVERIDLNRDRFAIHVEPRGDHDGRTLLPEGWVSDGSAEIGAARVGGQHFGYADDPFFVVQSQHPVVKCRVAQGSVRNGEGSALYVRLEVCNQKLDIPKRDATQLDILCGCDGVAGIRLAIGTQRRLQGKAQLCCCRFVQHGGFVPGIDEHLEVRSARDADIHAWKPRALEHRSGGQDRLLCGCKIGVRPNESDT